MASGRIISWQIDGEMVADFIFLGSKVTADGNCSHEIKRPLLLGRKDVTNLDSMVKSRDITLQTKVRLVKAMVFLVIIYGWESWTIKKAKPWKIDAFELWCWRRLLRVPWTERRSNQCILKEISPGISLEGMMVVSLDSYIFLHIVQLLSHVRLFATPWTAAGQASLSITNSRSLLKLMPIESVMPSNHLILCWPLLLLPWIFPSIRVFSNESALHIRWPKYWSIA